MYDLGFFVPKTDKKIIGSIAKSGKAKSPYDLKDDVGFSYTGVAKRCRELEMEDYLTSFEYEGATKGKKIDYSITLKGCALAIGLIGGEKYSQIEKGKIEEVYYILEKNHQLSNILTVWKEVILKVYLNPQIFEENPHFAKYLDVFIKGCFIFSGIRSRIQPNFRKNLTEEWLISYLFFEIYELVYEDCVKDTRENAIKKDPSEGNIFFLEYLRELNKFPDLVKTLLQKGKLKIDELRTRSDILTVSLILLERGMSD